VELRGLPFLKLPIPCPCLSADNPNADLKDAAPVLTDYGNPIAKLFT
jgi:hypothetical protein